MMMEPADETSIQQQEKNAFAASQDPPIDPCTNAACKFTGCTCGNRCGCNLDPTTTNSADGGRTSCDPCMDFKAKKQAQQQAAKSTASSS